MLNSGPGESNTLSGIVQYSGAHIVDRGSLSKSCKIWATMAHRTSRSRV